jgi:hypothetical protein
VRSVSPRRLPQLNRIAFGILEAGQATVGVEPRVEVDRDARRAQLRGHVIEVSDAKVDHPHLLGIPEIIGVLGEGGDPGRPCFLAPGQFVIARWS